MTSSPNSDSLSNPQHTQAVGAGTTTRSRGQWAGKGLRAGLRRMNPLTAAVLPGAARSTENSSSVAFAKSWSTRLALRSERRR